VIDSPAGKTEMRTCDHQAVLPMYLGVTKKVPQYNHLISSNIVTITEGCYAELRGNHEGTGK
jgi:branched-chain amino acid transport system substrate-binding protein